MVYLLNLVKAAASAALFFEFAVGHPGEHHGRSVAELAKRSAWMSQTKRSISLCSNKLKARGIDDRAIARRSAWLDELRARRASNNKPKNVKVRRDLATVLATSHNKTGSVHLTPHSNSAHVFAGNISCIMEPETIEGPYYVSGELVRNKITTSVYSRKREPGIPFYVDIQLVDTNTCSPLSRTYLDFWHCNSTGVYSGVVAEGNGNSADASNVNNTALRGLAATDRDGAVQFTSIFPGHYSGRTTHVHVASHINATVLSNGTLSGGSVSHVGQLYFDQGLISAAEMVAPYSDNQIVLTTNAQDSLIGTEAENGFDPIFDYVLLGDSIEDGIFAWISVGVDAAAEHTISAAVTWTDHGGVANNVTMNFPGGNFTGVPPDGVSGAPTTTASVAA